MSRPRKCRKVCAVPGTPAFDPVGGSGEQEPVILTVDEYETIRLIDREGLSQEQCSRRMHIARTTVQQIYTAARWKLAEGLVSGRPLRIRGGDYQVCGGESALGSCDGCEKRKAFQQNKKKKGDYIMRIAVAFENGLIFQHFGHTEQFKLYDVAKGEILATEVVDTDGTGHGALAGMLAALNVDTLICGGIGGGAQMALAEAGIRLFGGVSGEADAAVEALLADRLTYNPNVRCDHHGEGHHHEGGSCGSHGCGGEHHCH